VPHDDRKTPGALSRLTDSQCRVTQEDRTEPAAITSTKEDAS
jgi:hypothetical protein